jgi:predicted enzyme related to lactoylglutathione lyase
MLPAGKPPASHADYDGHFIVEVSMPDPANGKICYIEIPATDVSRSSEFYSRAFGWTIRQRGDGATAFDDTTGQVSGAWVTGRPPHDPGLVVYIMVENAEIAVEKIKANGGDIVQPIGGDPGEITARFRDPGGNILAIYQEPKQPDREPKRVR